MKILIDIGHPAHVHYFRNFIKIMREKGHKFYVTSRNKEIEHYLLKHYQIPFFDRGVGKKSFLGKFAYLVKADYLLFKEVKNFKPDLLLSFDSVYLAHASKLSGIPHIAFDDTEHAKLEHILSLPFTKTILTPSCYTKELGNKQIRFNGYMELCYLHPNYFSPVISVLNLLKVRRDEKYVIIRFVSWNAAHDVGQTGLTSERKREIVHELSKKAKVFISSEGELPKDLKKYQIK
jgi:predicted glycosyltransferase